MANEIKKIIVIHPEAGISSSGGSQLNAIEMTDALSVYYDVELISAKKCSPHSTVLPCIPRSTVKKWQQNKVINKLLTAFVGNPGLFIESLTSFLIYTPYLLFKKADVIYPNNDYGGLAVAWLIRAIKGTPFFYTEHAGLKSDGIVLKRDLKFKPDLLVVFNKHTFECVKKIKNDQVCEVIPNGVDLEKFTPEGSRIDHGLGGKVILFVGSLSLGSQKRLELLIDAIEGTDLSLLVCGAGIDQNHYQEYAKNKLDNKKYKFLTVDFEQMPEVYRSADVFTLPSLDEPFGRVYLEAMACNKPVVAPDDAMRKEIIGSKSGFLCDVENISEYRENLIAASCHEWLDEPLKQARMFSWSSVANKYHESINEIIK